MTKEELIIGFFEKGYCCDLDEVKDTCLGLLKENQELKSQLKGTTHCYDEEEHKKIKEENEKLKKLLEEKTKIGIADHKYASKCEDKVIVMEAKQKKFIKYLEDEIEQNTPNVKWKHYNKDGFNDYDVENSSCIEIKPTNKVLKDVLQKYREIIGGKYDKK